MPYFILQYNTIPFFVKNLPDNLLLSPFTIRCNWVKTIENIGDNWVTLQGEMHSVNTIITRRSQKYHTNIIIRKTPYGSKTSYQHHCRQNLIICISARIWTTLPIGGNFWIGLYSIWEEQPRTFWAEITGMRFLDLTLAETNSKDDEAKRPFLENV